MVRGTGKFKQKRGGGRSFSRNMTLDEDGTAVGEPRRRPRKITEEGGSDKEEESEEEEEDEEEEGEEEEGEGSEAEGEGAGPELSRTERRDLKKKQAVQKAKKGGDGEDEDEDDPDLINPNHVTKKMNISDLNAPRELTRREREQKEKADAKEKYWKLHMQGKTQEAKADLSRLAKIRAEREAAQAKRKAEADAKAAELEAKKKAQTSRRAA